MGNLIPSASGIPYVGSATLSNGQGTTPADIVNGQQTRVQASELYATNTDVMDHVVDVIIQQDGTPFLLGSANVPSMAGSAGAPTVLLLTAIQGVGLNGIALDPFSLIQVANEISATVAGNVVVVALGQGL